MYIFKQLSIYFRVFSFLLLSVLILVTSQPMQAQGPVERGVADPNLEPSEVTPGPPAEKLAAAMDIPAEDLVSVSIGESDSRGTGVENEPLGDFFPTEEGGDTFAILSTGLAVMADDPDENNDEVYKAPSSESGNVSTTLEGLNNSQGYDLVQLTLVLDPPPGATGLNFDFAFYSEEFPGYIESSFNDAFLAELGKMPFDSKIEIVGNKISSPNNFAFDPNGDVISVNAAFGFDPGNPNPNTGTTYDGTSGLLRATGCLPEEFQEGENVVLILSITDLGDSILDSAVFLDNFQWGDQEDCTPGIVDPEAYHISFQKEWQGLDQGQLPDGLQQGQDPDDFKIVATSDLGTVTCHYENNSLVCDNNNELLVSPAKTYTVREFNVPVPWEPEAGAGVVNAVEFDPEAYPECDDKQCTHTIINKEANATAISLVSFKVEANDGRAMIIWETGTEIDNAGFNLYRSVSPDGPWTKINTSLIVAEGDPFSGASYTFVDMPGRGNFYYRLEDVDYFGLSTLHDPVLAELGAAIRVPWFRPSLPEF
jgi:hypothetical protein